ncbi:phosphoribosylanthranilate isomerase [Robinsoniella peoriensis]
MTKIKICGLKRQEDIGMVNDLSPDYIGFVFAKSSRQVTAEQADVLKKRLLPTIKAVGVFVNEDQQQIVKLCEAGIIDLVQLHGDEDMEYILELKSRISCPVIKAVRVQSSEQIRRAEELPCDYLLLDTYTKGQYGGSGQVFDRTLIPQLTKPFFLAGGLTADNVAASIQECKKCEPYGVDVSSAVETDGVKDRQKIAEFILRVRGLIEV